jgi:SH3-like domain-containing protein
MTLHQKDWRRLMRFVLVLGVVAATLWSGFLAIMPPAHAQQGRVSSLPLPRFVSLRTEPVNMRTGPGVRYPVTWVYQRRNLPVEVTEEFDAWRQVRDPDGVEGWIHQRMLSGQRTGLVTEAASSLYKRSVTSSTVIAEIGFGVVVVVDHCPKQAELCLVEAHGTKGWLLRGLFWGLYDGEFID